MSDLALRALALLTLDPKLREWLAVNDPQALGMVEKALADSGHSFPNRWATLAWCRGTGDYPVNPRVRKAARHTFAVGKAEYPVFAERGWFSVEPDRDEVVRSCPPTAWSPEDYVDRVWRGLRKVYSKGLQKLGGQNG